MICFEITITEQFLLHAVERRRLARPNYRQIQTIRVVMRVVAVLLLIGSIYREQYAFSLAYLVALLFFAFSTPLERWRITRNIRRAGQLGQTVRVELDDTGFTASTATTAKQQHAWTAFSHARGFDDGCLLFFASECYWLPFASLTAGSSDAVRDLLRRHIVDYKNL